MCSSGTGSRPRTGFGRSDCRFNLDFSQWIAYRDLFVPRAGIAVAALFCDALPAVGPPSGFAACPTASATRRYINLAPFLL